MAGKIRKAVFPVAGLGTRFLPATKAIPKEMLPIVDKPLIQYALEEARSAGIEDFIFVTSRGKSAMEDHFDTAYELEDVLEKKGKTKELEELMSWLPEEGRVVYTRQSRPLGLGHAVWCAREFIGDEPFAVLLPDELVLSEPSCTAQMADIFEETGGNVIGVVEVPHEQTSRYGILETGADDGRLAEVTGLVEKPKPEEAPSTLAVMGRYILLPQVFEHLSRKERGAGNEIQLTDAMAKMIGHLPFHGFRFKGVRHDCGNKLGFLEANIAFALEREDMRQSVIEMLKRYGA